MFLADRPVKSGMEAGAAQWVRSGRPLAMRSTPKTRKSTAITAALCAVSQVLAESSVLLALSPPNTA